MKHNTHYNMEGWISKTATLSFPVIKLYSTKLYKVVQSNTVATEIKSLSPLVTLHVSIEKDSQQAATAISSVFFILVGTLTAKSSM